MKKTVAGAFIKLELDASVDWDDSRQTQDPPLYHQRVLRAAVEATESRLFVGVTADPLCLSSRAMNHFLLCYYGFLETVADEVRSVAFESMIVFQWPGYDLVREVLLSERVEAVLALEGDDEVDVSEWNVAREEVVLPPLKLVRLGVAVEEVVAVECKEERREQFKEVVIGGTFDHLHEGHRILIAMSAQLASVKLVIGLSHWALLKKKKHVSVMQSFQVREKRLREAVHMANPLIECDVHPLHDMYGPSGTEPDLEAIVVSEETRKGGPMVNEERVRNGLGELEIVVVGLVSSHGSDAKVSSTQIRQQRSARDEQRDQSLREKWNALCASEVVGADAEARDRWWARLWALHEQPDERTGVVDEEDAAPIRHYHNLWHLHEMFSVAEPVRAGFAHAEAVDLTVWFHDAIYDPRASDNEAQSAELFREFAQDVGVDERTRDAVVAFILATKTHRVPEDLGEEWVPDLRYLLDMDLAVLGREDPYEYAVYSSKIRLEYWHVPIEKYLAGRTAVLQQLGEPEHIYLTEHFRGTREAHARRNMKREAKRLEAGEW